MSDVEARAYARTVRRQRSRTREWTDHNVSDPGITLLQVLVYALPAVVVGVAALVVVARRSRRP